MSLKIRMTRAGAKKRPFFKIVIAESRSPRDGRFIEKIGTYDPMLPKGTERVQIDVERAKHWLSNGAQPSDRVARFLSTLGLVKWEHATNVAKALPKAKAQERLKAAEAAAAAAVAKPAEEAAPAA